ncbi:MAG: endo-1,4-beta-xylanase, partial [Bacteroidaceae bacterium]|nr:endo-1,4-beta-xylanase [Bacteroidaceae bacterium]
VEDGGHDGGKCHVINNPSAVNPWECQAAIDFSDPLEEGKEYYLHFWAKAENEGTPNAAYQNPTNYSGRGDYPAFSVSPTWKEYTLKTTVTGDNCKRLCFNLGTVAGKIYLDDIEIYWTKKSNTIPLTDQEKKDTLTWAMDTWIKGMMEATDGKVKAWDVVNEAISGGGNVDGYYALQHSNADTKDDFFWQDADKLGDIDYVRTAVASARKHFKGDAADLKLFVNDYNLESTWDNNRKLESLIYWIGKWEADNVTKIDGIGTQMHISMPWGSDEEKVAAELNVRKAHIERMFQLMAASGKLCRVSELDLGVDTLNAATGQFNPQTQLVKTQYIESLPLEKRLAIEQAQADYYQWILEKYFEIIPVAQQYGFCQWCLTDSPEDSKWRKGEPVGLWNLNYQRKPAYAGWAEGLKN